MTHLYRLVYTSRNLLAGSDGEQEAAVARIVAASRRNNVRDGVTGALMFTAGSFAQVLEGARGAVEATFERIQRDPRHGDISVLLCEFVPDRVFPEWTMAFVGRTGRGRALYGHIGPSTGFDLSRVEADGLCSALLDLVRAEDADGSAAARTPKLDVDRLRSALDAGRPGLAAAAEPRGAAPATPVPARDPALDAAAGPGEGGGAEPRVLRAALDEERERTTALRRVLDEARVALERSRDEGEALARHRDIWADRSAQLRGGLKAAREALRAAEAERDALRARVAGHDGEVDGLRAQRDIWAERTRALAAALCREPAVERDQAAPEVGRLQPVERVRAPLVKVSG